jgi:hypothetical protein
MCCAPLGIGIDAPIPEVVPQPRIPAKDFVDGFSAAISPS